MAKANKNNKPADRVLVIIPKPDDVIGDTETVVGVNGMMYQIEYDMPVEVPKNVADVIASSQNLRAEIRELTETDRLYPGKEALASL